MAKPTYPTEFKELAVKRIKEGQSAGTECKELGLSDETLRNGIKAAAEDRLNGAAGGLSRRKRGNFQGCTPRICGSSGRTKS